MLAINFNKVSAILGLFLLTTCTHSRSTHTNTINQSKNDSLIVNYIREGKEFMLAGNIESSKRSFENATSLLTVETDTVVRMKFLNISSELNRRLGKYEECLESYFELTKLALLKNDSRRLALNYYNIASIYISLEKWKEAGEYSKNAQRIFKKLGNVSRLNNCFVQYAIISRKNNHYTEAKKYIEKTISYYKSTNDGINLAISFNNYGNIFLEEKKYHQAIKMYEDASIICDSIHDTYGLAIKLGNISEVYLALNDLNSAKKYLDSSISIASTLEFEQTNVHNLERLVTYYKKSKQLDSAFAVTDRLTEAKLNLLKIESDSKLTRLHQKLADGLKINNLRKEKELILEEKETASLRLYISLVITISVVIFAVLIYRFQKKVRENQSKIYEKEKETFVIKENLLRLTLTNKEEQQKYLEEKIESKKNEIIFFSQFLKDREQFLERFRLYIAKLRPNDLLKAEDIVELKELLKSSSFHGEVELQKHLENINESFHFNLQKKFPFLSQSDINLASLIVTGLSSKEISKLLFIETRSVDKKRYRLKRKLNLDAKTDLQTFLRSSLSS